MAENATKGKKEAYSGDVLKALLHDPTRSVVDIAKEMKSYRQKVWRKKKALEDGNVVWGYTAVVDESKLGHVMYFMLMKMKPMDKELANLVIERQKRSEYQKQQVRLITLLYVNGTYDWLVMFSAPNHAIARRYYDSVRLNYEKYLLEKPILIDVNFQVIREGKVNPEIERLHEFEPL
ncbi:MAG: Lrp/AsnC family transcriptional regulator [Methanobacteriota archaeon]